MEINRHGCTRIVLIFRTRVVKIPNFMDGWKLFLMGLLANMNEANLGTLNWEWLCPVTFNLRGGWLLVMKRARVMTEEEFLKFDYDGFIDRGEREIPVENKPNSFGYLDGKIVAIDYGE